MTAVWSRPLEDVRLFLAAQDRDTWKILVMVCFGTAFSFCVRISKAGHVVRERRC